MGISKDKHIKASDKLNKPMSEKIDGESKRKSIDYNNLLTKIWFNPKNTLEYILKNHYDKDVTIFFILGGIVRAIDRATGNNMGDDMSTIEVLTIAIISGALFGWITYYIYAWAISVTGRWLNGKSKPAHFRTIIAWALVPSICSLILLVPEVMIFGDDLFKSEPINQSLFLDISLISFLVLKITLSTWSMVIVVKGISLIQNFGIWKSILNMILPGLAILITIIILVLVFYLIKPFTPL